MTERKARPSGFVAKCRCGVYVAAVDVLRTPADDARTMLGRWLWDGLTVEPRFGSWLEKIDACQCGKGGEDADEAERLRQRVSELEAKLASYDRAERDQLAAALEAAREDALRLDALEAMVNESPKKAFLLHHGMLPSDRYQYVGLGLSNTGRTLRQAIDQARGKGWEEASND